jgi:hypothetical protein
MDSDTSHDDNKDLNDHDKGGHDLTFTKSEGETSN